MKIKYYFNIKIALYCLLKMYKYFDKNEISKMVVNALLQTENYLSSALVFVRVHKIKRGYMKSVKLNDGLSY